VRLANVGDKVAFDVFAVVVGTNASISDDRFISMAGSFKSIGQVRGDLSVDLVLTDFLSDFIVYGFDGLGASQGLQQDLDADGDMDVGSNVDSNAQHFWAARYVLAPSGANAGSFSPTSGGRRIGFGTFTVTGLGDGSTTDLNFIGRNWATAANYIQDGVITGGASTTSISPIRIQVPEPTQLTGALLAVAAGCAARRRRRPHRVV
jgi:hypothetical protein